MSVQGGRQRASQASSPTIHLPHDIAGLMVARRSRFQVSAHSTLWAGVWLRKRNDGRLPSQIVAGSADSSVDHRHQSTYAADCQTEVLL